MSALAKLHFIRRIARISLGLVWLYEGLIPKILFAHLLPNQTDLVMRSGFWITSPQATIIGLGIAQTLFGIVIIIGWRERMAVMIATLAMSVMIVLVARGNPSMLIDPFGALVKDICLLACALIVWLLASEFRESQTFPNKRSSREVTTATV